MTKKGRIWYTFVMDSLNTIIAKNLTDLRKKHKLTQLELAEKLNYSDKAVSKWEQGESLPGIEVLHRLSRLYEVSLDYITGDCKEPPKAQATRNIKTGRAIITLLCVLAVWFVATVCYTLFNIFGGYQLWILFCWCVPASLTVALIFDVIWHERKGFFFLVSTLVWSLLLTFCLQFMQHDIWVILGIGAPAQVGVFLWAWLAKLIRMRG